MDLCKSGLGGSRRWQWRVSFSLVDARRNRNRQPRQPIRTRSAYVAIGASDAIGVGRVRDLRGDAGLPERHLLRLRAEATPGSRRGDRDRSATSACPAAVMSPAIQALGPTTRRRPPRQLHRAAGPVCLVSGDAHHDLCGRQRHECHRARGPCRPRRERHAERYPRVHRPAGAAVGHRLRGAGSAHPRPGAERADHRLQPSQPGAPCPMSRRNTAPERAVVQRIAVGLADRVNAMTAQNVLVIDLLCSAVVYSPANVSSDGFHPSDQGYQLMADLAYPAMSLGTAPPPGPSCAQRTLLPVVLRQDAPRGARPPPKSCALCKFCVHSLHK